MPTLDFTFAWEGAPGASWAHLRVVSFQGTETLSNLPRYDLTLLARDPAPLLDPADLIGQRATLRIATLTESESESEPTYRLVHGLMAEAEEIGPVPGGMLYRIALVPPLARAMYRKRCRIFLEKTTRQIIDSVLQGDPAMLRDDETIAHCKDGEDSFEPARERYAWRVVEGGRIDDVSARPYCVQYNESDFDFVSRLLEDEGIAYHFEHGDGLCLLVLSDKDIGRSRIDSPTIESMKLGARMRPRKVSLRDYHWLKPALDRAVAVPSPASPSDLVDGDYPGGYTERPELGRAIASARLERLDIEAAWATGEGTCRSVVAGSVFALHPSEPRYEGEYLVTKLECSGEQLGVLPPNAGMAWPALGVPYRVRFECARRGRGSAVEESRFRPARVTPKPRIRGTQTAFVTDEPSARGAEIHVGGPSGGEIGCVRVRFHWDDDPSRHAKEPTSCWVRVNQVFAGPGEGAVFHPRVGVEVIVDFEDGDPDRPIVVGRVYNGQNRPPSDSPTVSTLKSMSSPGGGSFNELRFDDTAGAQQILLHTPFDWNNEVGHDRTEQVAVNSASAVGADRSESTGGNRAALVGANNSQVIGANESVMVGADRGVMVGGDENVDIGGSQKITVTGAQEMTSAASQKLEAPEQTLVAAGSQKLQSAILTVLAASSAKVDTALLELIASGAIKMEAGELVISSGPVTITGGDIKISGGNVGVAGGKVTVQGGSVDVVGGLVKLN